QASSTPSPGTPNDTKSTYFAAMIYYRKTLFGCGPKLTAVHTNLEPHYVRENGSKSTVGAYATGFKFTGFDQPVVSVRLTLGH
ncbi:MAG: hypothetical protein NTW24_00890, partial [Proteobacteria bacterium]|nr:hypothetical protein [Pseudomonadota bacterium]